MNAGSDWPLGDVGLSPGWSPRAACKGGGRSPSALDSPVPDTDRSLPPLSGTAFARRAVVARDALLRGANSASTDSPNLLTVRSRADLVAPSMELLTLGFSAFRSPPGPQPLSDGGADVASEGLAPLPHEGEELVALDADGGAVAGGLPVPVPAPLLCPVVLQGEAFYLPPQFGVIEEAVYRGAYPAPESYPFLARLGLRTVVNLLDKFTEEYRAFTTAAGIAYVPLPVKGNKAHCEEMDRGRAATALALLADVRNHPVLVHCRSGKHRTGALVGCLRMLQAWSVDEACTEYVAYCRHKQREVDKEYIERFDPRCVAPLLPPAEFLVPWLRPDCCNRASAYDRAHEAREAAAAVTRVSGHGRESGGGMVTGAGGSSDAAAAARQPESGDGDSFRGPSPYVASSAPSLNRTPSRTGAAGQGSFGSATGTAAAAAPAASTRPTILRDGQGRSAFTRDPPLPAAQAAQQPVQPQPPSPQLDVADTTQPS